MTKEYLESLDGKQVSFIMHGSEINGIIAIYVSDWDHSTRIVSVLSNDKSLDGGNALRSEHRKDFKYRWNTGSVDSCSLFDYQDIKILTDE